MYSCFYCVVSRFVEIGCDNEIPANHHGTGNEKKVDCPKSSGSTCITTHAIRRVGISFTCNNGMWYYSSELQNIFPNPGLFEWTDLGTNNVDIIALNNLTSILLDCGEDIAANHLMTGNERKRDCPTPQGSTCIVPKADGSGSVSFECNNGQWILAGEL